MPVVLFDHARVDVTRFFARTTSGTPFMTELLAQVLPERVETDRRLDLSVMTRLRYRAELVGSPPRLSPLALRSHDLAASAAGGELPEAGYALISQHDVPCSAGFG
jgi:hypothetical protein